MVTQELIDRFFKQECSTEECIEVLKYLESNPVELDKYLNENEWNYFEAKQRMDPALSKKLFERISKRTVDKNRKISAAVKIGIAASIILMIGFGWILLINQTGDESSIVINKTASISPLQTMQRVNTTNKTMTVLLDDGSTVELEPNSYLKYYRPFDVYNKRNVYLEGTGFI